MSRTFPPHHCAFLAVATSKPRARDVATSPRATNPPSVRYTTWAMDTPVVQWTSEGPPRVTPVPTAGSLATLIGPIWPSPAVMTPIV